MAVLGGEQIASPRAWLSLVTHRRALDEHRARMRAACGERCARRFPSRPPRAEDGVGEPCAPERDLAEQLDDRVRLRQLLEGLRTRLGAREREAAALCYLQGLSREDAAVRMQLSERRMRRLMEGRGPGRPGVAAKVGAIVRTISEGSWCEEQGSLMRALAFGVLDPDGERHGLASRHAADCPACRAYVASLRGLAVVLPPALAPGGLAAGVLACAGGAGGAGAGTGALAAGAGAGAGAGGAASSGWLLGAGPVGAKLAAGCLLALSIGAGCVALGSHPGPAHPHLRARRGDAHAPSGSAAAAGALAVGDAALSRPGATGDASASSPGASSSSTRASREFGPEGTALSTGVRGADAQTASAGSPPHGRSLEGEAPRGTPATPSAAAALAESAASAEAPAPPAGDSAAAQREFTPG